jgi:hypothetical protein
VQKKTQRANKRSNMKTESNNETRRQDGATEDRGGNVANVLGAVGEGDPRLEDGRHKISFPEAMADCRSTTVLLAEAAGLLPKRKYQASEQAEIIRLTAMLEQRDAEIAQLKERARRRLVLDEKTIHAGAPVPDLATRMPMVSLIGCSQDQQIGVRSVKRSFWSRWF